MKKLRILLTACGCPGASTLIRMLKNNGEREIEIVGVDMDAEAIGRFLVDRFYPVPAATSDEYIPRMLEITKRERPDILFPESSQEVYPLALNKVAFEKLGTRVLVSDAETIATANNKWLMYEKLKAETDINLPKYYWPRSLGEFLGCIEKLGYPDNAICFKPHIGKGSRGFRIIDPKVDRQNLLLNYKPNSRYISLEEFIKIFESAKSFPDFLVMEYLDGKEYTTDSIALNGEELLTMVKTMEQARWGVVVKSKLVKIPELINQTKKILSSIRLSYNINIQFIGNKLIEINPRVSSFIYQDNLIPPYIAIKLALGELSPNEVRGLVDKIQWGRRMIRYMDQIFWNPQK